MLTKRVLLAILIASTCRFAAPQPTEAAVASAVPRTVDTAGLEAAFDEYFGPASGNAYTGAVVAVVKDGAVQFVKGYGYEDAAHSRPVVADETRFRLGSITKTLVALHVASLLDKGVVKSIDDPVNDYLKRLQVPDNAGVPITLRMLATHEAEFAEKRQPFMKPGDDFPLVDGAYIRDNMPGFVRKAGTGANYSNFGIALLEYAMEDASGQSFDDFAAREIFARAGMSGALIATEPKAFPHGAQSELLFPDGAANAIPDDWANHPINKAAGGMAATGEDMARYMIGLLGGSPSLGIPALLSEHARSLAFAEQGATHPLVQKYGIVFMLNDWNGVPIAEHGGRTIGTSSYLTLLPEQDIGIFVAATGERGVSIPGLGSLLGSEPPVKRPGARPAERLPWLGSLRAIALERMLGTYRPPLAASPGAAVDLGEYSGEYVGERRPLRSSTRWITGLILGGALEVAPDGSGGLRIGHTPGYVPIGKDVFWRDPSIEPKRPSGWSDIFVFRRDAKGRVADASSLYTDVIYQRAKGVTAPSVIHRTLALSALVLLTGLLSFLWAKGSAGRLRAPVVAVMMLAVPFVYFLSWPRATVAPLSFVWTAPQDLMVYQTWLLVITALVVSLVVAAVRAWRGMRPSGWRGAFGRAHLTILALAALPLLWSAWVEGLIGWNLD